MIRNEFNCVVCSKTSFDVIYKKRGKIKEKYLITDSSYGVHHQIVQCLNCGMRTAYPREEAVKVVKRYEEFKDDEYENEISERAKGQKSILKKIEKIKKNKGSLLDVGCATGGFLELAKDMGWQVKGVEPSKWASRLAREKGLDVFQGLLSESDFEDNSFDVVVCIDVIEHADRPNQLIEQISKKLKNDGLLCLVTPDINSVVARLLGERWWHIRPDHIHYFSEKTLTRLIQKKGFQVLDTKRYGWNFSLYYWISRLEGMTPSLYKKLIIPLLKSKIGSLTKKIQLNINFHDSIELYAMKD